MFVDMEPDLQILRPGILIKKKPPKNRKYAYYINICIRAYSYNMLAYYVSVCVRDPQPNLSQIWV